MAWLTASDGARLHYRTVGSGPAIILQIGSGGDAEMWDRAGYVKELAQDMTCVLFDHRGHGQSDRPPGWQANSVDRYASDVAELLDELSLPKATFWGYSAAIDVGIRLADQHADRVAALVGTGSIGPITVEQYRDFARDMARDLADHGWEPLLAELDAQETKPAPGWMSEGLRGTDVQSFVDWLTAIEHATWTYWDLLPTVTTPALFLVGALEDPDDETELGVHRMANGQRHRLPGSGHIDAFVNASAALPIVKDFLSSALSRP